VNAEPRAEIQWFRGTKELVGTPKYTIFNKGTTQTLMISNVHLEDEEEYSCKATNSFGSRTTRAQLKLSGELLRRVSKWDKLYNNKYYSTTPSIRSATLSHRNRKRQRHNN
jgi:hypothetical protein